jgi:hypothetical protein
MGRKENHKPSQIQAANDEQICFEMILFKHPLPNDLRRSHKKNLHDGSNRMYTYLDSDPVLKVSRLHYTLR